MLDIGELKIAVESFGTVWFPPDQSNQKFWFRARDDNYKQLMQTLCDKCFEPVNVLKTSGETPQIFVTKLLESGWHETDLLTLSIMIDQIPRNALAIQFGPFSNSDRTRVDLHVDDSYSLSIATDINKRVNLSRISDIRIICFFSLVFRHSNRFDEARKVLRNLVPDREISPDGSPLPALAQKFWNETTKRENASMT